MNENKKHKENKEDENSNSKNAVDTSSNDKSSRERPTISLSNMVDRLAAKSEEDGRRLIRYSNRGDNIGENSSFSQETDIPNSKSLAFSFFTLA